MLCTLVSIFDKKNVIGKTRSLALPAEPYRNMLEENVEPTIIILSFVASCKPIKKCVAQQKQILNFYYIIQHNSDKIHNNLDTDTEINYIIKLIGYSNSTQNISHLLILNTEDLID